MKKPFWKLFGKENAGNLLNGETKDKMELWSQEKDWKC